MTRPLHFLDPSYSGGDDSKPPRIGPMPVRAWLTPTVSDLPGEFTTVYGQPREGAWVMTVEDGQRNDPLFGELDSLLDIAARREVAEVYMWSVSAHTFQRLYPASGSSTDKSLSALQ